MSLNYYFSKSFRLIQKLIQLPYHCNNATGELVTNPTHHSNRSRFTRFFDYFTLFFTVTFFVFRLFVTLHEAKEFCLAFCYQTLIRLSILCACLLCIITLVTVNHNSDSILFVVNQTFKLVGSHGVRNCEAVYKITIQILSHLVLLVPLGNAGLILNGPLICKIYGMSYSSLVHYFFCTTLPLHMNWDHYLLW